jgi:hypothetical protein
MSGGSRPEQPADRLGYGSFINNFGDSHHNLEIMMCVLIPDLSNNFEVMVTVTEIKPAEMIYEEIID